MSVKEKLRRLLLMLLLLATVWSVYRYPIIRAVFLALASIIGIVVVLVVALAIGGEVAAAIGRDKVTMKERLGHLLAIVIVLGLVWSVYRYPVARAILGTLAIAVGIAIAISERSDNRIRKRHLRDLKSEDESVREKAVTSLRGDLATVDDLAAAFASEPSARVRRVIVETLLAMSRAYLERDHQKAEYEKSHPSQGAPATLDLPGYAHVLEKYVMPPLIAATQSADREEREAAVMALLWIGTEDAMKAIANSPHQAAPPPMLSPSPEDAQFTAYYPDMTNPDVDNTLYVYAYVQGMLSQVHQDAMDSGETSGGGTPASRTAKRSLRLPKETPITITPECEHVEFAPLSTTEKWNGEWMRSRFTYKTQGRPGSDRLTIRVSITVLAIEVAHIECATKVKRREAGDGPEAAASVNPLAAARFGSHTSVAYQGIFISYSRKDDRVVRMYQRVQKAVGNDVFIDTDSIRPGEGWEAALAKAIDTADIFQLFWSENSATSSSVRDEWDYALNHRCLETRCVGFIRPVYWSKPMPAAPDELRHLNFRYVPLLEE